LEKTGRSVMSRLRFALLVVSAAIQGCSFANGSATLNWSAVNTDAQGAPLKDIAGYKIYYGTAPRDLRKVVVVADPNRTNYRVGHLTPGTWYFSVVAYTKAGAEGSASNVSSKTIQ
jgi:Fibronectin type III domain